MLPSDEEPLPDCQTHCRPACSDQENIHNDKIKESEAKKRKLEPPNRVPARSARATSLKNARPFLSKQNLFLNDASTQGLDTSPHQITVQVLIDAVLAV